MTETQQDRRLWRLRHYAEKGRDPEDVLREVTAELRDRIRREGYVIDYESVDFDTPVPVTLTKNALGEVDGYLPATSPEATDGTITEWTAGAVERITDNPPGETTTDPETGAVTSLVPEALTAQGGGLSVRHNLGGPVTVRAFGVDGQPHGYLLAVDIDDATVHVEMVPGVTRLVVTADET